MEEHEAFLEGYKGLGGTGPSPSNTVPPSFAIIFPTMSDMSRDHIFPVPPASYPAHGGSYHAINPQCYGPLPSNDGTTHIHHATGSTRARPSTMFYPPTQDRRMWPSMDRPLPSSHVQFDEVPGNFPATLERGARGATQHLNDANHNLVVPNILMSNVYKNLAILFVHSPQSNIVMMSIASLGINSGRCNVTIELEVVDAASF
ncbi:hypothetical protein BGW80DRAFT_1521150 [Lactifluus volemus]|nr:hypothetical protein BGW80DRAFT_1521150 [Lactifluus volemus]